VSKDELSRNHTVAALCLWLCAWSEFESVGWMANEHVYSPEGRVDRQTGRQTMPTQSTIQKKWLKMNKFYYVVT